MDLSFTANILGIISFLVLFLGWINHLIRKFKAKLADITEVSETGKWLAEQLLSQATKAESRADIHTFIKLKVLAIHTRRTHSQIQYSSTFVTLLLLFMCVANIAPNIALYYLHPLVVTFLISIFLLMTSLAVTVFYEFSIRKMESGWLQGIEAALDLKIKKHTSHL